MKRRNWKRTAAFVTSLTMATTMMPAELSSVLVKAVDDPNIDAETAKLDWTYTKYEGKKKSFITELKLDGVIQTNLIYSDNMSFDAGTKVEITSKVPLEFSYLNAIKADGEDQGKDFDSLADEGDNKFKLNYEVYGLTKDGDQFKKGTQNISVEAALAEVLRAAGYNVADETFTAVWDGGKENVVVTFAAKETKNSDGTYTYSFTMPDDNNDATNDSVTVKAYKESIKVNFYESTDKRTEDQQNNAGAAGDGVWTKTQFEDEDGIANCDNYFNTLGIETSTGIDATYADVNGVGETIANVVVGDTVTLTAEKPFIVLVSDGNDRNEWIEGTYSYDIKENKYKVEFTMPALAEDAANAIVDIVKIDEEYQYSISSSKTKLIANSTNTSAIRDLEAAGIVAKYYDGNNAAADAAKFGTAEDEGKEITGAVPNGAIVVVGTSRALKLTEADATGAFIVKKNGKDVADDEENGTITLANPAALPNPIVSNKFVGTGKAGTYEVTYKVKGKDNNTYNLSYSFRIKSKDELTAEDVELELTAKKNNADANILDVMSAAESKKTDLENGKVVNFMLKKGVENDVANANYQFTVAPKIRIGVGDGDEAFLPAASYYITGDKSGSTINGTEPYEFVIHITDPEYGGSVDAPKDIKIQWKVIDYNEIPHWQNNRFTIEEKDNDGIKIDDASITIDDLGENSINLKREVFRAAYANDAANAALENNDSKLEFQSIKAPGADRTNEVQDELDTVYGLPSELGDYTVYVVYDRVVQATVDVHITKYALGIFADESDLTFKYGHTFELTKPTVQKNINGETVNVEISDLTCKIFEVAIDPETKEYKRNEETGEYVKGAPVKDCKIEEVGQLNAGLYLIEFAGTSLDEDYFVKTLSQQVLTVNKKSLDDPSLIILIDPFTYDGEIHDVVKERAHNFTVRDTDFEEDDERYDISDLFKITEGGTQKAAGAYECKFKLVSDLDGTDYEAAAGALDTARLAYTNSDDLADDAEAGAYIAEILANTAENIADAEEAAVDKIALAYAKFDANRKSTALNAIDDVISLFEEESDDYNKWDAIKTNVYLAESAVGLFEFLNTADGYATTKREEATNKRTIANAKREEATNKRTNANNKLEEYNAALAVAYNLSGMLDNFEGSTKTGEWHITVQNANDVAANVTAGVTFDAGLTWDDDKTTLYDNGRIHLEINRNANDKIRSDKKTAKIAKFGVVVEKEGKIAAPADYNPNNYTDEEKNVAKKFLQVGMANKDNTNGFSEGGYTKTTKVTCDSSKTYKVNISVKDAETGVWARPFVQYEDGSVSYGDVKYINLTNEAIKRLELSTAEVADDGKAVRKADLDQYQTATAALIMDKVKSGYNTAENKFYVYTRYVDLQKAGFTNVAEVADFGIVADREGDFAPDANKADVKKALKKETAKVVGHYNKNNAVLGVNEYAASIKLGNAATGCWVRSYIDLGNGLVIYDEPQYIMSASEYYGEAVAGEFTTKWEVQKGNDPRLVFTHTNMATARIDGFLTKAKLVDKDAEVEVVKTGVVADKNNLLDKENKMVLGSGYIDGYHKGDIKKEAYAAKLTPVGTNDVSVRTYTIFKIKGAAKDVEVTVYGPVYTFPYVDAMGCVDID